MACFCGSFRFDGIRQIWRKVFITNALLSPIKSYIWRQSKNGLYRDVGRCNALYQYWIRPYIPKFMLRYTLIYEAQILSNKKYLTSYMTQLARISVIESLIAKKMLNTIIKCWTRYSLNQIFFMYIKFYQPQIKIVTRWTF